MTAGMEQAAQTSGDDDGRKLSTAETVVTYLVILVGAVGLMFPFAWMLSTSLKPLDEVYSYPIIWIPSQIVFENYIDVFKKVPFARYLWNSFVLSVLGIIGNMSGSSLAAFSFARLRYPGRTLFFIMMLSTMMVPVWVTMVPTFIMFSRLGWLDTYLPILLPAYFAVPFFTFLMRQFFLSVPVEIEDSARIDGCSSFGVFFRILMPLSIPALATVAIFSFFFYWNDLLGPLIYLRSQLKFPVAMGIASFQSEQYANFALMMAAATMALAPMLVVFFFTQRLFIQGVVITGVKG